MRRAIRPDLRLRPTDEAFDLESANRLPCDLATRIWLRIWGSRCSPCAPPASRSSARGIGGSVPTTWVDSVTTT